MTGVRLKHFGPNFNGLGASAPSVLQKRIQSLTARINSLTGLLPSITDDSLKMKVLQDILNAVDKKGSLEEEEATELQVAMQPPV